MKDLLFKSEFYEDINYLRFFLALALLIFLTKILQFVYTRYSDSPTNKKSFSTVFVLFSVSIFLIVTTIKSSLALSLGMVGALSIIRFRTAIKEPEQIIYFLGITGISIAIAAEKEILAVMVVIVFVVSGLFSKRRKEIKVNNNLEFLLITLKLNDNKHNDLDIINELIEIDKDKTLKCKNFSEDDEGNVRITFSISNPETINVRKIKEKFKALEIESFNIKIID
jgi:hypothetical protein